MSKAIKCAQHTVATDLKQEVEFLSLTLHSRVGRHHLTTTSTASRVPSSPDHEPTSNALSSAWVKLSSCEQRARG